MANASEYSQSQLGAPEHLGADRPTHAIPAEFRADLSRRGASEEQPPRLDRAESEQHAHARLHELLVMLRALFASALSASRPSASAVSLREVGRKAAGRRPQSAGVGHREAVRPPRASVRVFVTQEDDGPCPGITTRGFDSTPGFAGIGARNTRTLAKDAPPRGWGSCPRGPVSRFGA